MSAVSGLGCGPSQVSAYLMSDFRCGRDRMTPLEMEEHAKHCDILTKYRHMRRHSVPSYVMCPQCGMRFTDRSDYRKVGSGLVCWR